MGAWAQILDEIQKAQRTLGAGAFDHVRRKYLIALSQKRGRAVILYASKWTQPQNIPPDLLSISDEDIQALMTVINGIEGEALDLILHSPGGSLEAAEALVTYLRSRFPNDICVIVPQQAMSAATMVACAGDTIMLGKHSFLGPTDPQFICRTELGVRGISAQDVEAQFERARVECSDPAKIGAWIPILRTYGPDLLEKCRVATELSKSLVSGWLERYMFKGEHDAKTKAHAVADWLGSHKHFKTHARHISREELRAKGLKIINLEEDPEVQDFVLSIFHATTLTFDHSSAVKLVENQMGKAFIKNMQAQMGFMAPPGMMLPPGMLPPGLLPRNVPAQPNPPNPPSQLNPPDSPPTNKPSE